MWVEGFRRLTTQCDSCAVTLYVGGGFPPTEHSMWFLRCYLIRGWRVSTGCTLNNERLGPAGKHNTGRHKCKLGADLPGVRVRRVTAVRWKQSKVQPPFQVLSWDSLLVRADLWLRDCQFESRQKWQENFLPQSRLCVLTLIPCPFHPRVTAVARKRPWSFYQKCRGQVTPKKRVHPLPNEVGVGRLYRCPGIAWELIRKRAHMQLYREHSATVISACWDTANWSCRKERN